MRESYAFQWYLKASEVELFEEPTDVDEALVECEVFGESSGEIEIRQEATTIRFAPLYTFDRLSKAIMTVLNESDIPTICVDADGAALLEFRMYDDPASVDRDDEAFVYALTVSETGDTIALPAAAWRRLMWVLVDRQYSYKRFIEGPTEEEDVSDLGAAFARMIGADVAEAVEITEDDRETADAEAQLENGEG